MALRWRMARHGRPRVGGQPRSHHPCAARINARNSRRRRYHHAWAAPIFKCQGILDSSQHPHKADDAAGGIARRLDAAALIGAKAGRINDQIYPADFRSCQRMTFSSQLAQTCGEPRSLSHQARQISPQRRKNSQFGQLLRLSQLPRVSLLCSLDNPSVREEEPRITPVRQYAEVWNSWAGIRLPPHRHVNRRTGGFYHRTIANAERG